MNEYVIGVDLGTSAVKVSAMNKAGEIVAQQSYDYPLSQLRPGYSEQAPQDWLYATTIAIDRLILRDGIAKEEIQGISFSGQMHGLVLLDENNQVLRPAILWNDTRTTKQCQEIWAKAKTFLLPKDYVRYCMTGKLGMDYSDATGTVLLDIH